VLGILLYYYILLYIYIYYIIILLYTYTILSSSDLFSYSLPPHILFFPSLLPHPSHLNHLIHSILVDTYLCLLISHHLLFFPILNPSHPVSVEIQSNTLQSLRNTNSLRIWVKYSRIPYNHSFSIPPFSPPPSITPIIHSILVDTYIYLLIFFSSVHSQSFPNLTPHLLFVLVEVCGVFEGCAGVV